MNVTDRDESCSPILLIPFLRRFFGPSPDFRWIRPANLTGFAGLVFSKNRACQLDALLRSLRKMVPACRQVHVLWQGNSAAHRQAYGQTRKLHPECQWIEQKEFSSDLQNILQSLRQETVMFCTDDGIFFAPVPPLPEPDWGQVAGIGLRLGRNCSYSHPADENYPLPRFHQCEALLAWQWRKAKGDFRVVYSLDAHVYPKKRILELLRRFEFFNPNQLEDRLNRFGAVDAPGWMLCPEQSCYVSLPINRVNTEFANRAGRQYPVSEEELLRQFLDGKRLDAERMVTSQPTGPHQEFPLSWRQT